MKDVGPKLLERSREVFSSVSGITLQDLRDCVAAQATGTQRRDMLSALDTVAERYRCDLATIRATPAGVRRLLSSAKAAELGVRPKRLANVQSCVRKALELYGNPTTPITKRIPLTAEWSALLDLISNEQHRYGLYRLATYASAMGLG